MRLVANVASEDRSGPSREANCRIDDKPMQRCLFTPLFGDGSFEIELNADRALRVVVDSARASVFEVFGPEKRVRLMWRYHRDPLHCACWVTDMTDVEPRSICVY